MWRTKMFLIWKLKKKTFKKNLDRQVYEGHRIATNKCDIMLNSKSEFHGPAVARVTFTKEPTANNNRSRRQGTWLERSSYLVFLPIWGSNISESEFSQKVILKNNSGSVSIRHQLEKDPWGRKALQENFYVPIFV